MGKQKKKEAEAELEASNAREKTLEWNEDQKQFPHVPHRNPSERVTLTLQG